MAPIGGGRISEHSTADVRASALNCFDQVVETLMRNMQGMNSAEESAGPMIAMMSSNTRRQRRICKPGKIGGVGADRDRRDKDSRLWSDNGKGEKKEP